jgi:two-component system, response regulator
MSGNTILLVDDNPDDVYLARHAFEKRKLPYRIQVAYDGAEALDYLFARGKHEGRNRQETPVLILLDLKMPKIGGLEVLRRLRADPMFKHLVVVVLTSSDEESDQLEAQALGTNLYIRKPENFDDFEQVVDQLQKLLP